MNYLAHLLLAKNTPESQIGNLLGDFVKGYLEKYETIYSHEILMGIKTHRQVDCFTDTHPIYLRSKNRISSSHRRLAGIIIDICYDHFLANHWSLFCHENLDVFVQKIYVILKDNQEILPEKLKKILPKIISENWLVSYKNISGINLTFVRLSKRLKRENNLATSVNELMKNYPEIESDFLMFFPEVMNYVKTLHK
ncbi:ACP phosphodiesterase [Dapis sp. BLCC M126]|uniref:acyl carrier protein phosphodiesterase n=1 Tax=Dapis sp. BLCC M126 TaxID=3400189 RepID=UPI003CEC0FCC